MAPGRRSVASAVLAIILILYPAVTASIAHAAIATCTYDPSGGGTVRVDVAQGANLYNMALESSANGAIAVVLDDGLELEPPPPLSCSGGTGNNAATSVLIHSGRHGVGFLSIRMAHWAVGTSIEVSSPSPYGLGLVGTDGPDRIHTGDLPFSIEAPSIDQLQISGLDGDDDLALDAGAPISSRESTSPGPRFYGNQSYSYIWGGPGDDTIATSLTEGANLLGDDGDDTLRGGPGGDQMDGGEGDDLLRGRGGNDEMRDDHGQNVLRGGPGNDGVAGGVGADVVDGGPGVDEIWGGGGDDSIYGRGGHDHIAVGGGSCGRGRCSRSADVVDVHGGRGNDQVQGDRGTDVLFGGPGADVFIGGWGQDVIHGGPGEDYLWGGGGGDRLMGEAGNDVLEGGAGDDALAGGAGDDLLLGRTVRVTGRASALDGMTQRDSLDGGSGSDVCFAYAGSGKVVLGSWEVTYRDCESGSWPW